MSLSLALASKLPKVIYSNSIFIGRLLASASESDILKVKNEKMSNRTIYQLTLSKTASEHNIEN